MPFIQTIMAAIDFSEYSPAVANYAVKLGKALGADLLFVNVINQRDIDTVQSFMSGKSDEFKELSLRRRHDGMTGLIESCNAGGSPVRTIVRVGLPYRELLAVIQEEKPDLLVIANKGRSNIVDVVMGSCARIMHRQCPIPVITIHGGM